MLSTIVVFNVYSNLFNVYSNLFNVYSNTVAASCGETRYSHSIECISALKALLSCY